jgi:hypothetical protein
MAARFGGLLKGVRSFGGSILKMIGFTTVATTVTGATSKAADYMTIGAVALFAILIFGGRR